MRLLLTLDTDTEWEFVGVDRRLDRKKLIAISRMLGRVPHTGGAHGAGGNAKGAVARRRESTPEHLQSTCWALTALMRCVGNSSGRVHCERCFRARLFIPPCPGARTPRMR